jgi:hypothetical protein
MQPDSVTAATSRGRGLSFIVSHLTGFAHEVMMIKASRQNYDIGVLALAGITPYQKRIESIFLWSVARDLPQP